MSGYDLSAPAGKALRLIQRIRRFAASLATIMNHLAGWNFILCAGFITVDVLFRNFGGFSSSATTEITGYMLAFGIAWGLAHALAARAHIRIDVLINRLPLAIRQYLHAFALALLTVLALFMAWCAWQLVDESILFDAKDTSALAIPLVIPQGLWAVGISALAVFAVVPVRRGRLPSRCGRRRRNRPTARGPRVRGRDAGGDRSGRACGC